MEAGRNPATGANREEDYGADPDRQRNDSFHQWLLSDEALVEMGPVPRELWANKKQSPVGENRKRGAGITGVLKQGFCQGNDRQRNNSCDNHSSDCLRHCIRFSGLRVGWLGQGMT
jgi:hypothetical protein